MSACARMCARVCVCTCVCVCACENSNLNLKLEKSDTERERDKERNFNFKFDCITLYIFSVISLAGAPWCEHVSECAWYHGMFLACCHLVQSCIVVMWDVVNIVMMNKPTPRNSSWTTYLVKIKYLHLVPKLVHSGKLIISVCIFCEYVMLASIGPFSLLCLRDALVFNVPLSICFYL